MKNVKLPDLKSVPSVYRPIPFWSWNEKLTPEETARQVRLMHQAGIGGFFMHARGGLQTEYMGKEWFDNVTAAVEEAQACDMHPWAYDENGWPSGFGNGAVNGLGVEYQQKYLRMEDTDTHPDTHITQNGAHHFYYDINPFYVDTLDKKVIRKFIDEAYKPYFERYGDRVEGFFTDEPQVSRNGIPWSFVFEAEYRARYNEDILAHLEELFLPVGDYKQTRVRFWKMVAELFSEAYFKQIYDQCEEWGVRLTGHLVLEESLHSQIVSNGVCMPHYEYFHIPGMDWLGRNIFRCLTTQQLGSAAEQLGKDMVLSETFACCGHNVSFDELKGVYEWQTVHGINLLCQHLEGYSLRGIRKRDYPPAMYMQQPWWSEYRAFVDAMSREGMVLSMGEKRVDVLLMHPQTTAWTLFDCGENAGLKDLEEKVLNTMDQLERKHVLYHFGDEILMERHAKVENGKLVIGRQRYSKVIVSCCDVLLPYTKRLLDEFCKAGGQIVTVDDLADNAVIDLPEISYTKRIFADANVHFFTNTSDEEKTAHITVHGKRLDLYTGELYDFDGVHTFEPWGSLMVIEDGSANMAHRAVHQNEVRPEGLFRVCGPINNALTLDTCDYYFDGELQEKNGYVLNVCERANALGRAVKIHQDYHVQINTVPKTLYLVCETPEKFSITVNGKAAPAPTGDYYVDVPFRKIDIAAFAVEGENTISFDCDFEQSAQFYANLKKAAVFESEKNKLVYDIEIEPIYLLGDFSVKTSGTWTQLPKKAMRYAGAFAIDAPLQSVTLADLQQQGFPFFCGELVVEGELEIPAENPVLAVDRKGVNALRVEINGRSTVLVTGSRVDLAPFGCNGKTTVKLTLINNLRNLLGPHHLAQGEAYSVSPRSFFKEPCVWCNPPENWWNDDYCFVQFGLL